MGDGRDTYDISGEERSLAQANAHRMREGKPPISKLQIEAALGYLAEGASIKEAAERTDLTPKYVERLVRRHPDLLEQVRQRFAVVMRVNLRAAAEKAALRVIERLESDDAAAKVPIGTLANIVGNFSERAAELDEQERGRSVPVNAAFTSRAQAVFEEMGKLISMRQKLDAVEVPVEAVETAAEAGDQGQNDQG